MHESYKGFWSLLAVAFIAFFVASAFDGRLSLGGHTLKTTDMCDAVLGHHEPDNTPDPISVVATPTPAVVATKPPGATQPGNLEVAAATPETPAVNGSPATITPAPLDTVPKTILFIGDSMLEGLSPRLAAYCNASGHKLYTVIWYSSTSERWGQSDKLASYIRRINPDYIFICLGANELFVSDIVKKRTGYVRKILADIGTIPYIWIGPPNWKPDTGINSIIAANASPGCYFKSDGMHFERKRDGAHPTSASAAKWLDSVVRWMPAHAARPIRLENPGPGSGRPAKVFIHQPDER